MLTQGRLEGSGTTARRSAVRGQRPVATPRTHTVVLHTGEVGAAALRWRAAWEVAEDVALVDGVTALRAAAWARTDRQAALLLCLVVQQRLTTGARLLSALTVVRN